MKLTQAFKQLKKEYLAIQPSELLREHGWNVLRQRIEEEEKSWGMRRVWVLLASVVLLVILGGAGTVYAAQSAKPGDALYPVKVASDRVAARIAPILARPTEEPKEVIPTTTATPRAAEKLETEKVEKVKEAIDAVTPVAIPSAVPTTPPALEVVPPVIPSIPSVGL